jgi:hypothetical protein
MADLYAKRAMFVTTMPSSRAALAALALLAFAARAQPADTRVILVPADGGAATGVLDLPPPPPEAAPPTRTLEALPPQGPPEVLDRNPAPLPPAGPSAMLDGHPREGSFLSGPGSLTFVLHHTLMTGLGGLATQMIPRALANDPARFSDEGARLAYLGLGLGGAAVGFAGSAIWQFTHWMGETTANTGIVTSVFGGMLLGGFTDLLTTDAYAITWMTVIGSTLGAWVLAMVGGGDLAPSTAMLLASGGVWAALYTAIIVAIIATTGGALNGHNAADVIMITPALGAGALALASLKFKPSTAQVMRANLFGLGVGGAFLLISALVLSAHFTSPVPYILGGVGAIGAQTLVSLLWAEGAEAPPPLAPGGVQPARNRVSPWW